MQKNKKTFIIIGAGAAGIFCAVNVAKYCPHLNVIILEKSNHILSKVRISGGGRCNFTNAQNSISVMSKCYPRGEAFVKKTFQQFFTLDIIKWFADRNVLSKTEEDGRIFPANNSSQTIIDCLLLEIKKYNVDIQLQKSVEQIIAPSTNNKNFIIQLQNKNSVEASYVLVACGGFNKTEQFQWITNLGHKINNPIPSLFTFNLKKSALTHLPKLTDLMGVTTTDVHLKIANTKHESNGALLITHWGISGPAVLTLSAFGATYLNSVNYNYTIQINWCSTFNETTALQKIREMRNEIGGQQISKKNPFALPNRLWEYLLQTATILPTIKWNELQAKQQNILAKQLCSYVFEANGKTTFKEEFVTAGGVLLQEINATTCESKIVPNLFFAGEIMDVDGKTGGYNFQHAWTSGWIVAKSISEKE